MRLFGLVDGSIDARDRAWILTPPFDRGFYDAPTAAGLEFNSDLGRIHFTASTSRMHFTNFAMLLHYTADTRRVHFQIDVSRLHFTPKDEDG